MPRRDDNKDSIQLAAKELFDKKGPYVKLKEIALAANVAESLIIYYFGSKSKLYRLCTNNLQNTEPVVLSE